MIGWIVGGRMHNKPSARKDAYLSTIPVLDGLTSEFPRDLD